MKGKPHPTVERMRHHTASDFESVHLALFALLQLVYTILPRYELMLPGEASAFEDLCGLRDDICLSLELSIRSRGSFGFAMDSTDCIRLIFAFDYTPSYALVIDIAF